MGGQAAFAATARNADPRAGDGRKCLKRPWGAARCPGFRRRARRGGRDWF